MRFAIYGAIPLLVPLLAAQHSLDLEGRYWIPQMRGTVRVEQSGFGTDIDTRQDLDIPDTNFPQASITWHKGRSRLHFSYTPIDCSGDNTVTRTILFRGKQYTVGTRVLSDLTVQHLQLSWSYQFIRFDEGKFRLGPLVETDGFLMHGGLPHRTFPRRRMSTRISL